MQLLNGLIGKLTHAKVELVEGYCLKCKERRGIKNATQVTMKNGRSRTQGSCAVCNTRMSIITKAQ